MAVPANNKVAKGAFKDILKKGKTVQCSFFFVRILRREGSPGTFGVVASSKIMPTAVERNRVRRVLTETARLQIEELMGYDVVCVLTRSVRDIDLARRELLQVFKSL